MRLWVLGVVASIGCDNRGQVGPAPDMNGVWAVTMKYTDGSCPDVTGGTRSSMWTVNQDALGEYTVAVQGGEEVGPLWGSASGPEVVLMGLSGGFPAKLTHWKLSGTSPLVLGRAFETRDTEVQVPAGVASKGNVIRLGRSESGIVGASAQCTVEWAVEATKQGG
jgi:hypothetical protein